MMIEIREFRETDQTRVRDFILTGMEERWGWLDDTVNPDLDRISESYGEDNFFLALERGELIGTGALLAESDAVVRLARMWVMKSRRRTGIGTGMMQFLLNVARKRGYARAVLETTNTWDDAIAFYKRHGFIIEASRDSSVHFFKAL